MPVIKFIWIFLSCLSDLIIIAYIVVYNMNTGNEINHLLLIIPLIILKDISIIFLRKRYYAEGVKNINEILTAFKRGKFSIQKEDLTGKDELRAISRELIVIGKYIDNIISTLKEEIKNLRELYNNIIFSISSYLIILNTKKEIIFVNDVFCKKFQAEIDEIIGKDIEDIFLFFGENLKNSIEKIYNSEEPVILEKTHLLSKKWISVIADIKISRMLAQGEEQIVMIIDDITSKCRKDYQFNLISQVTESIQRDEEIHRILYTILYGITSGSGLGFNRAMLFLLDQKRKFLAGELAVGPDSMEEAIEIWNSMPAGGTDIVDMMTILNNPEIKGKNLLQRVKNTKFSIETDNIFIKSFNTLENIHIHNSWNDNSVDESIKAFMDVSEFVVVPLIVENRAIGIIVADNKFTQVPIGKEHIELLSIFAVQASLLIDSYHNVSALKKEMDKIKEKQEAMIESEKLAAIGRISSHVAHEIRNPLVTMGGYARRIVQQSNGNEKIKNAAEVILKESIRLESTLSNVMDLTKPQSLIKNLNNINSIIMDTINLLKNVFAEKKLRCKLELSDDLPLANSDQNQIKQVILNLVQNAIDATPADGLIEISTYTDNEDNKIVIKISDTGTGISTNNLDNIFEPFFTTKITGVGLGLAIVHKMIKDHNGEITARNREEGGAEFIIKLPFHK